MPDAKVSNVTENAPRSNDTTLPMTDAATMRPLSIFLAVNALQIRNPPTKQL